MLGEFIAEALFEGLLGSLWRGIKASIGFVFLYLCYWRPQRVRTQLAERYGNRYATAGAAAMRAVLEGVGVGLLLVLGGALLLLLVRAAFQLLW
ncbi:hypothetical protein [Hymenobacter rubripertinctus]|uniref:Uncharacterized protein n=1 Tax=Hymenobacter rubripertinctus TaxID=2029981 RepID=A0A418QQ03_9BACT|nr:hypothetical protein [Hymenobacter rubripertinctus]RIY07168.1 hypothetical protein D0T11_17335 [Hymenobacter rubripertinctus]